jgi:hypothetical protein
MSFSREEAGGIDITFEGESAPFAGASELAPSCNPITMFPKAAAEGNGVPANEGGSGDRTGRCL